MSTTLLTVYVIFGLVFVACESYKPRFAIWARQTARMLLITNIATMALVWPYFMWESNKHNSALRRGTVYFFAAAAIHLYALARMP